MTYFNNAVGVELPKLDSVVDPILLVFLAGILVNVYTMMIVFIVVSFIVVTSTRTYIRTCNLSSLRILMI